MYLIRQTRKMPLDAQTDTVSAIRFRESRVGKMFTINLNPRIVDGGGSTPDKAVFSG